MKPLVAALILMLAAVAPAAPRAAGPGPGTQRISVPLTDPARPATLKVSRINGSITVEGYAGKEVLIESSPDGEDSEERPRRGASGMRRIPNLGQGLSVDEDNNVVRVEARNPSHGGDIHVQVPAHCSLHLSAVNGGEIRVSGVEGEIELSHVNGGIVAQDVAGSVAAHTTNGNVKVVMRRVAPDKPMAFSTLNGDVDVTFPADLRANVRIRSDRGDIYSDFEVAAHGHAAAPSETRQHGKHRIEVEQEMQGSIGGGGPEILFKTFNGDIFIRRGRG
ncbi:MAG TPA: DUF4097 family beta strand repeat-containing protein [Thermoanaerobaculia bacterium]|nr:DUF4097 family beta strand repeat-containing protein [Thermoanaerobaculia bacterium]